MRHLLVSFLLLACSDPRAPAPPTAPAPAAPAAPRPPTPTRDLSLVPNDFYVADRTYVRPTAGDDRSDQIGQAQINLLRDPSDGTTLVTDTSVTIWPTRAIVYGGPHINSLVARARLPFDLRPGRLEIGGEVFEGDDIQLITVVPADGDQPAFCLYAGTGTPGIQEINGNAHGNDPILVSDRFGRLAAGKWLERDGRLVAELGPKARRIAWRTITRADAGLVVRVQLPEMVPAAPDDEAMVEAVFAGVRLTVATLALAETPPLDVYLYPDARSKQSLTKPGDGHAVPGAHALHVIAGAPEKLKLLVAHEATHVLATDAFGMPGTSLFGEGLAVWVAGQYGGRALSAWRLDEIPDFTTARRSFRKLPEAVTYVYGGTFVAVAVELGGLERVIRSLYRMDHFNVAEAFREFGLPVEAIEAEVAKRLRGTP